MLPRPGFRLPLWSATAVVGLAYLARSFVRGSMRPDLPADAIVLGMLLAVIAIVALVRAEDTGERDTEASSARHEPPAKDAS